MSRFREALDAWHGSHADFDEFRDDKINTGEGAQAYGHGHYVGEAKGTGESYRDSVSRKHGALRGMYFTGPHATSPVVKIEDLVGAYDRAIMGGPSGTLRSRLRDIGASHLNDDELKVMMNALATAVDIPDINPQEHIDYGLDHHQEILDSDPDGDDEETNEARTYIAAHPKITKIFENLKQGTGGRLYQLKVDLSEPHVLDWDNTLADHHPESAERLKDHLGQLKSGTDVSGYNSYVRGYTDRGDALGVKLDESMSGQKLYNYLKNMHGSAPAASEALRKTGINGIRYLDQYSRLKWQVWKDKVYQARPYDTVDVHGLVDKSGTVDPKQVEEINKEFYDQFGVKPRTLEDLIHHIARDKLNGFGQDGDEKIVNMVKHHKMLNWIAENQRNLEVHTATRRVTPPVPEKPKDLTYNYVVFDPKLIKMVRKYDDRGNVVHDYTQASGTELRPVDHDPFAEEKK